MRKRGVKMGKNRIEAFSDGVLAIIITIMVLELKVPHGDTVTELLPLVPVLLSYVLSFIYLGIYWNNHHHMLHTCHTVRVRFYGQICIFSFGSLLSHSQQVGWERTRLQQGRRPCMASYY